MLPHKKTIRVPKFLTALLITGALYGSSLSYYLGAQPDPGGDPDVPISGIGMLLAAGAAFGAKKAYDIYHRRKGR